MDKRILRLVISALCLALAYVLPFLTGQIPQIGAMILPMHIPVLLCGFICGWKWGLGVGFIAPLLRSITLGAPILFPGAVCMAFELGVYGLVAGLCYMLLPKKKLYIYVSLLISMISGRIIWGIAMAICMGIKGSAFTFGAFIAGAFTNAIIGIIIQIVLIPVLVMAISKSQVLKTNE
jgi:thiamine transporter ThiT